MKGEIFLKNFSIFFKGFFMLTPKTLSIFALALLSQTNAFAVTESSLKSVGLNSNEEKTPFQVYKNAFPHGVVSENGK